MLLDLCEFEWKGARKMQLARGSFKGKIVMRNAEDSAENALSPQAKSRLGLEGASTICHWHWCTAS
jgi:hypothetical protein